MKIYESGEWDIIIADEEKGFDPETNRYVDNEGYDITGIIKDFKYYSEGDPRNDWFVLRGKRFCAVEDLRKLLNELDSDPCDA